MSTSSGQTASSAGASTAPHRGMVPEDVYDLVGVSDPRVSPDGSRIAYVRTDIDRDDNSYKSAIHLVAADGSAPPRRFTHGPKRDASPRWSPDGAMLAFVSNRDTDAGQLWVIPADGGEARRLTDSKTEVSDPVWSPDGTKIAFTARVRDEAYEETDDRKRAPRRFTRLRYKLDNVGWVGDRPTHIFVVDASGESDPVQVTDGPEPCGSPAWAPDGARIAFAAGLHDDADIEPARDVYTVAATGGTPERVTAGDGVCAAPSWSPDARWIAYRYQPGVFDSPRHTQIAVVDVSTKSSRILTASLDRNCAPFFTGREPLWDGTDVLFGVEDHGNTHVWRVAADGSRPPEPVVDGELAVAGYDQSGGTLAWIATTHTTLGELFTPERQLTFEGRSFSDSRVLQRAERFTAVSKDGSAVEAWIMPPVGRRPGERYPVLLNIHGGPFTQYGTGFFDEFQVYAAAGYAVVFSNPRGSSGYDEAWGRAIRGPIADGPGWGTVDYEDLMAVVDAALEQFDWCDANRLGVMGGSYGGYMTSWIVGHTDRFAAACSERAVNNWVSMFGSSDIGWTFKSYFGGDLFDFPDEWRAASPSTYVKDITTPLLILHAENDLRCPVEQAEHLFTALRLLRRDVEFVRFPGDGHEMSRSGSPVHRVVRFETILDYFAPRLGGSAAPPRTLPESAPSGGPDDKETT